MTRTLMARRLLWAALAVVTVLVYLPGLRGPFVYDDKVEVVGNATIRFLDEWQAIGTYNPARLLLIISYALNYHYSGMDPLLYHVVSLALHLLAIGAALALGEAVGRLGGHPRPLGVGALVAGLWALHPMATQAVTYITGRSESLCGMFILAALALWAGALLVERGTGRVDLAGRSLALLAGAAALLSKEVAVALPLAALALELIFPGRLGGPGRLGRLRAVRWAWYLPMGLLLVGAVALRVRQVAVADVPWYQWNMVPAEVERPLAVQLTTQAEVWLRYLGLWLVPARQTVFHVVADLSPRSAGGVLAIGGWAALVGAAVLWGVRNPMAGWAFLSGALFLLPSSSLPRLKEPLAEHRAYLFGYFLILGLAYTAPRRARWAAALGVALLGVYGGLTVARNTVWASEVAIWREAAQLAPDHAAAWYGLGDALRFDARFQEAMEAYRRSTTLDDNNVDAWNNLGITRAELGDVPGARDAWRMALRRKPSYCKAHNNLGFLALRQKSWDEALVELSATLTWCPDNVLAHWGLGNLYYGPRRDPERAIFHYQRVLDLDPDFDHEAEIRKRLLELTW